MIGGAGERHGWRQRRSWSDDDARGTSLSSRCNGLPSATPSIAPWPTRSTTALNELDDDDQLWVGI